MRIKPHSGDENIMVATCSSIGEEPLMREKKYTCERPEDHLGNHQAFVPVKETGPYGEKLFNEASWSEAGSTYNPVAVMIPVNECDDCGFKLTDDTKTLCYKCLFFRTVQKEGFPYFITDGIIYRISTGKRNNYHENSYYEIKALTNKGVITHTGLITYMSEVPDKLRHEFPNNAIFKPIQQPNGRYWVPYGFNIDPDEEQEYIDNYEEWS